HTTLRAIGLSNSKVTYVLNVARFAKEEGLDLDTLNKMDNEAVITYLTRIKGVVRWTAEMLLMFGLGREDIFAIDNWVIQNAMVHSYNLDRKDRKASREKMLRISAKWSPWRTYACMYLWRYKDNQPVDAAATKRPSTPQQKPAAATKRPTASTPKPAVAPKR